MDPERTAGGATGESAESFKPKSTMQDVLSEIQSLVEKSNIINVSIHFFYFPICHGLLHISQLEFLEACYVA